jgi:maltooligosyltrehalose trehalohydrolase
VELDCEVGAQYRYAFQTGAEGEVLAPDPASRGQAGDVFDPSMVVDAQAYAWRHPNWRGRPWQETVLYELHPGAMGGFAGIIQRLPELAELGITAIELMPVAEFPGRTTGATTACCLLRPTPATAPPISSRHWSIPPTAWA